MAGPGTGLRSARSVAMEWCPWAPAGHGLFRAAVVAVVLGVYLSAIVSHNAYLALTPLNLIKGRYLFKYTLFENVFQCSETGVHVSFHSNAATDYTATLPPA